MTRVTTWSARLAAAGVAAGAIAALGAAGTDGAVAASRTDPLTSVLVTGSYGHFTTAAAGAGDHGSAVDVALGGAKRASGGRALLGAAAPTVWESLVDAGESPEEACEFARGYDPRGCRTAADLAARGRVVGAAAHVYDSVCVDIDTHKGDGHKTSHACNIRFVTTRHGADWYVLNKMKQTARVTDGGFLDDLDRIGVRAQYRSGNKTVDWAPAADLDRGSCRTSTSTVTEPRSGVSYSTSSTVCPDTWGPYAKHHFRWFGGRWEGIRGDDKYVGTNATSIVHSPPRASARYRLHAFIHWT